MGFNSGFKGLTSTCFSNVHMLQGGRQQEVWNMMPYPWVSGIWSFKRPCYLHAQWITLLAKCTLKTNTAYFLEKSGTT